MDVKTFVLFTLIFPLIMAEATNVQIQATGVSDDGEGLSLADHQPRRLTLYGPHIGGKDDELMGTKDPVQEEYVSSSTNNVAVVPDSGDLMIPVVNESPLAAIEKLGRRILVAAVESNSSAAPGY